MSLIPKLVASNLAGEVVGLPCFCTANEHVLRAILAYAKNTGLPVVIEATCNQVNQFGGYTGMTAEDFVSWLGSIAAEAGVPMEQLILGGDHLGPNVWKAEPLHVAMEKSRALVKSYVEAGFKKIHLDTSMACGGETNPTFAQIAERAADLCEVAETYAPNPSELIYIIGTEVPIPGGETDEPDTLDVTSVTSFRDTIQTHRDAWQVRGLNEAWDRIVSVVTQPGVDFGHTSIYPFAPEKASLLREAIQRENGLTYEAHSTDYQSTQALSDLVKSHFFFLKVGPELTFRFREAIWALSQIENEVITGQKSNIRRVLEARMMAESGYWEAYYSGTEAELRALRSYSYSDRIRYYWSDPEVAQALDRLIENLGSIDLPETIVSQAFMGLDFGEMPRNPRDLIALHVQRCVSRYYDAAGQL